MRVESWVTQYFGFNTDIQYASGYHNGLDLVPIDRQSWGLFAPSGLEIMQTGKHTHYGRYILAYDQRVGARWRFAHLDAIDCKKGDKVPVGHLLGVIGSTGNSTARHLHIDLQFMRTYAAPDFANQPTGAYSDPLPALRYLGVNI
jgi:murein DD-endopeptidase MepM/ murein hydrolase activator NlpD